MGREGVVCIQSKNPILRPSQLHHSKVVLPERRQSLSYWSSQSFVDAQAKINPVHTQWACYLDTSSYQRGCHLEHCRFEQQLCHTQHRRSFIRAVRVCSPRLSTFRVGTCEELLATCPSYACRMICEIQVVSCGRVLLCTMQIIRHVHWHRRPIFPYPPQLPCSGSRSGSWTCSKVSELPSNGSSRGELRPMYGFHTARLDRAAPRYQQGREGLGSEFVLFLMEFSRRSRECF